MVFQNNLLMGAASASGGSGHTVGNSLIFNQVDSAVLKRTPSSASNRKTWTFSFWMKRGKDIGNSVGYGIFSSYSSGDDSGYFESGIHPSEDHYFFEEWSNDIKKTTAELQDSHAWYHIVLAIDTTQSTAEDRQKVYINGVRITAFDTNNTYTLNQDLAINLNAEHWLGGSDYFGSTAGTRYFDGYLAECVLCDGTQYEASDFGEYDSNKIWRPKDPSGLTFGTNGFYLNFADSSALGNDVSGNNNDWTPTNLAASDQSTDTPTNNQCVLTPLYKNSNITLSEGNLKATSGTQDYNLAISSMAIPESGKWVCEFDVSADATYPASLNFYVLGVTKMGDNNTLSGTGSGYYLNIGTGEIIKGASVVVDTGGPLNGTLRVEYDADNDTIEFFDDGTEVFPASTGASNTVGLSGEDSLHFGVGSYLRSKATFSNLSGTPSSGFKELSPANLPTPAITDSTQYFQETLYTGNGSTRNIDQTGNSTFQPDLVWIKNRSQADTHALFDAGQGVTKYFASDSSALQVTNSNSLTSFDSDGFSLGTGANGFNDLGEYFASWLWKAGGGAGSSNEDGSINTTSTSVDQTSGISISIYTGNATSGATVGHGLGVTPQMLIIKPLDAGELVAMYHEEVGNTAGMYLGLNGGPYSGTFYWNDTSPGSSVFTLGNHILNNGSSKTMVAYAFAEKVGFSKFGKYYGTGSATIPPLINLGFKPSFLIIKNISAAGDWLMYDDARSPVNEIDDQLFANTTAAETTGSEEIKFLSTGFAPSSTDASINTSGNSYIYAAWAANPFGGEETTDTTAY